MKIYREENLKYFDFWGGAKQRVEKINFNEFDLIEEALEDLYPDGMSETEINDLFWFDFDVIANILGYDDEEDFDEQREDS